MKSKTLRVVLAGILACSLAPATALAENPEPVGTASSEAAMAASSSTRSEGGMQVLQQLSILPLFGAFSDVEDGYRATWQEDNGISTYTYRKTPNGKDKIIEVPGVKEIGVDVSYHNNCNAKGKFEPIDWEAVKDDGITFAIVRVGDGYVDSDNPKGFYDSWFVRNIQGAKAAGLKVGVYVYSRALNTKKTGKSSLGLEVTMIKEQMKAAGLGPEDLELPVFFDMEHDKQGALKSSTIGAIAESFCEQMQDEGYQVGIYSSQNWYDTILTDPCFSAEEMQENGWMRWVARYSWGATACGVEATDLWQFSSIGIVNGMPRKYCDMNFAYVDFGEAPERCTITYHVNGGILDGANPVTYTGIMQLPKPTREGYQFDGWYLDEDYTEKVTSLEDVSAHVYAKWSQPIKVTYKLNGGKNNKANFAKFGGSFKLQAPTRKNYTFGGWFLDKKFKTKVTKLSSKHAENNAVTVYAKWFKNYKITYKLNGGKNNKANPAKYGGELALKAPTRSGYKFKGWYTNKKLTKKVTKLKVTKKRTVYAKWAKLKGTTYKVVCKGGLNIRKKASTKSAIVGSIAKGKKIVISKVSKGWGKLASGRGYVKLKGNAKKV